MIRQGEASLACALIEFYSGLHHILRVTCCDGEGVVGNLEKETVQYTYGVLAADNPNEGLKSRI